MKTCLAILFGTMMLTAQSGSGGHVGGPTDGELWNKLSRQWGAVTSTRPEDLPRSTPRKDAQRVIDAADAARSTYLKTKESLYRSQSARLRALASTLAGGGGSPATRELAVIAELDARIDSVSEALRDLASRQDTQSLAESSALRALKEKMEQLRAATEKSAQMQKDSQADVMAAEVARQRAIAALNADAASFESLADSTAGERFAWHDFYQGFGARFCGEDEPCSEKR